MTRSDAIDPLTKIFTPAAPVNSLELFAGRIRQAQMLVGAINQVGQHAVVYGERGVGKTSLVRVLPLLLKKEGGQEMIRASYVNCESRDDFASLWRRIFRGISLQTRAKTPGFILRQSARRETLATRLPKELGPYEVMRLLAVLSGGVVIIDEFDRLDLAQSAPFAELLKGLSDHAAPVTLLLVGAAESVEQLVAGHESVDRCLVQVLIPRMSQEELAELVTKRFQRAKLSFQDQVPSTIASLSQGFPHYAHLLGLKSATTARDQDRSRVQMEDVRASVTSALGEVPATILSRYAKAMRGQRGGVYAQLLLACTLSEPDALGFFSPDQVGEALGELKGQPCSVRSFARKLRQLCTDERGAVLQRRLHKGPSDYRFSNPMMRTFLYLKGLNSGQLPKACRPHAF